MCPCLALCFVSCLVFSCVILSSSGVCYLTFYLWSYLAFYPRNSAFLVSGFPSLFFLLPPPPACQGRMPVIAVNIKVIIAVIFFFPVLFLFLCLVLSFCLSLITCQSARSFVFPQSICPPSRISACPSSCLLACIDLPACPKT
jgi:hypothetical protein